MRISMMLIMLATVGCAGEAQLQSALSRLPGHADCALACAACIAAIHGDGQGMDAQPIAHIRCAAECARCGVDLAEDIAVIASAGEDGVGADVDVSPAPLPDQQASPALLRVLPPEVATCQGGE